MQGKM